MSFQKSLISSTFLFALVTVAFTATASAQATAPTPTLIIQQARRPMPVAGSNNLYCAGLIQTTPINTANMIVGAEEEADKFQFAQDDYVFINMGRSKGVNVGDMFAVVRPRGEVNSVWTHKHYLGFYVQEVGALEVVNVKADVSVARVKTSCDVLLMGDLLQPTQARWSPPAVQGAAFDKFSDPSGKVTGRIVLTRDAADMLARDFIAYVDLGGADDLHVGDKLTIFRPLEKGNVTTHSQKENVTSRDYGFESFKYRGGKFSNQSGRKTGEEAYGNEMTSKMAKSHRPDWLRKNVGEAVVLNVREQTATIVITKTGQEIHPGDWVELK
ncbi:MAG: hypothetical protein ABIV21_02165 [Pyrinomonadaceae bacterium]